MAKAKATKAVRLTDAQRKALVPSIVRGFVSAGEAVTKIAPTVRKYLKGLSGDKLEAAKRDVYDGIRAEAPRTERGGLCPKAKLPAKIAAAYQAAAMGMMRALKPENTRGGQGRKKLEFGAWSVKQAEAAIQRGQKAENTPLEVLAAWQALKATAEKHK